MSAILAASACQSFTLSWIMHKLSIQTYCMPRVRDTSRHSRNVFGNSLNSIPRSRCSNVAVVVDRVSVPWPHRCDKHIYRPLRPSLLTSRGTWLSIGSPTSRSLVGNGTSPEPFGQDECLVKHSARTFDTFSTQPLDPLDSRQAPNIMSMDVKGGSS